MIFARIETEEARRQLQHALTEADRPYIYRRLLIIQFSALGTTVNELATLFQLTPLTIRKFIHAYNTGGISQLMPQKKPGRKAKLSLTKEQWLEILHQSPATFDELDTACHNWTLELLARYVEMYHGVRMQPSALWHLLRRHKINMGRSQWKMTSPDPEYRVKRERVEELKKKAATGQLTSDDVRLIDPGIIPILPPKEAVVIYFDETDIHLCPDKGKGYQLIHHQQEISTPGTDQVKYLLGGVVYPTGEGLYHIYVERAARSLHNQPAAGSYDERKRTMEVENWLAGVCEMFPDQFKFYVWDNATTHTTKMLFPFFEAHPDQIIPVFLPTYSPWLNLIERLWWQMRSDITRNHFFQTIQHTCQAIVHWLEELPLTCFLSLIGIQASELISSTS